MTQTSIRERRIALRMSQVSLALLSGVSRRTITRCETANKWPRYHSQRRALCMALGLDWGDLERER